jgi:hypothetical protein
MMIGWILASADSAPDVIDLAFSISLSVVCLGGLVVTFRAGRHPDASKTCIRAAITVFGGLMSLHLTAVVGSLISQHVQIPVLLFGLLLVEALTVVAGIAMAIGGLFASKKGQTGRTHAVSALLLLAIIIQNSVAIIRQNSMEQAREDFEFAGAIDVWEAAPQPLPTDDEPPPAREKAHEKALGFPDFNFRHRLPGPPYRLAQPNIEGVMMMLMKSGIEYVAFAEAIGADCMDPVATAQVMEGARSGLKDPEGLQTERCSLSGVEGLLLAGKARFGTQKRMFKHWIAARNGFVYQLVIHAEPADARLLEREWPALTARWEIIDPDRICLSAGAEFIGRRENKTFGLTVDLTDTTWFANRETRDDYPGAILTGQDLQGVNLAIVPFWYGDRRPSEEAIHATLLGWMRPAWAELPEGGMPVRRGGLPGRRAQYTGTAEGGQRLKRRVEILVGTRCAYAVSLSQDANLPMDSPAMEVMRNIRFSEPELTAAGLRDLEPRFRETQAELRNEVGVECFRLGDYATALHWFRSAAEINPDNEVFATNACWCLENLGRFDEVVSYVHELPDAIRRARGIRARRAVCLGRSGRAVEAAQLLKNLFAEGYRDDGDFGAYVACLEAAGWVHEIDGAFEKYLAGRRAPDLQRDRAAMLARNGLHREAVAALEQAVRMAPASEALRQELAAARKRLEDSRKTPAFSQPMSLP